MITLNIIKRPLCLLSLLLCLLAIPALGQVQYTLEENIAYVDPNEQDAYKQERCKLDIYYPVDGQRVPVVVWLHGGGLKGGNKNIPAELKKAGLIVVAPNYRLSPKATHPAYIDDAAQAVAWTFANIARYGGSTSDIYVAGHSAGGYLALMVGMDRQYLARYGIVADSIKGLIPVSGQTNTHYTIRKERGQPFAVPVVDALAPLNHVRADLPPILLVTGARELELAARYEENAHLAAVLKAVGHKQVTLYEMHGFDHGTVRVPACFLLKEWIGRLSPR